MKIKIAMLAAIIGLATSANAADLCRAVALQDVRANGDTIPYGLRRGEIITAVTQLTTDRRTGITSICSHGGGCYPATVVIGGRRVPTLRMLNCSWDMAHPGRYGDETIYSSVVDRRRNSARALREDDVDNALLEMGLCSACAGNAAAWYARRPTSPCGIRVRQALEGNPIARRRLLNSEDACTSGFWR